MGYLERKENGLQPDRFVIHAVVGGILVNVQHIKSAEEAKEKAEAMFDGKVCTYLEVVQHFMYDALDGKQRGDWLLQMQLGEWQHKYDAEKRDKIKAYLKEQAEKGGVE